MHVHKPQFDRVAFRQRLLHIIVLAIRDLAEVVRAIQHVLVLQTEQLSQWQQRTSQTRYRAVVRERERLSAMRALEALLVAVAVDTHRFVDIRSFSTHDALQNT